MGLNNPVISLFKKTDYTGGDCSGSEGDANRELTHTKTIESGNIVIIGGAILMEGASKDYSRSANVITFHLYINDSDVIQVIT